MDRCARIIAVVCVAAVTATMTDPATAAVEPSPTELVSSSADGIPGDGFSYEPQVSANGRFVVFSSRATNLVPDDTNQVGDVFVKDVSEGSVERVSVDEQGNELASQTWPLSISADGRYVLFTSSYEPVESPDGEIQDRTVVRLADRAAGTSRRIEKRARNGGFIRFHGAQLTGNGRYLVFSTGRPLVRGDRDSLNDVYRLELATGALRRVTTPPLDAAGAVWRSYGFSASHSGRVIALLTTERLVRRDRREDGHDVYVRDLRQRRPRLASVSTSGAQASAGSMELELSATGRYVLFTTRARNLVRGDSNRKRDVFVRDLRAGTTKRVSVNSRERQGDRHSGWGSISADGRFVVLSSLATNLAPGATDFGGGYRTSEANLFVRDRQAGTTTAITMAPDGTGADDTSGSGVISRDGSTVVFFSSASNLVDGVNGDHVFLRRLEATRD